MYPMYPIWVHIRVQKWVLPIIWKFFLVYRPPPINLISVKYQSDINQSLIYRKLITNKSFLHLITTLEESWTKTMLFYINVTCNHFVFYCYLWMIGYPLSLCLALSLIVLRSDAGCLLPPAVLWINPLNN